MNSTATHWNFTLLCPTGLSPWVPHSNDLAPCFQQLFLQIPSLVIFAILSSYHSGRRIHYVLRNATQFRLIHLRIMATFILGLYPLFKVYYVVTNNIHIWPIDVMVGCVEIVTYFIHLGFLLTLRRYGGISHRGPLLIGVTWSTMYLLSAIWLVKGSSYFWPWSIVVIVMHSIYAISLIPAGDARLIISSQIQQDVSFRVLLFLLFRLDLIKLILGEISTARQCLHSISGR